MIPESNPVVRTVFAIYDYAVADSWLANSGGNAVMPAELTAAIETAWNRNSAEKRLDR
jgi:hypothetical protein